MSGLMVESITVMGQNFHIAQVPAVMQKRLLLLMGSRVALGSAATDSGKIDNDLLVGSLMGLPEHQFDDVAAIVLSGVHKAGESTPVTIESFQGSMMTLWMVIAEGVNANLSDFFIWLDKRNEETRKQRQAKKPQV